MILYGFTGHLRFVSEVTSVIQIVSSTLGSYLSSQPLGLDVEWYR